MAGWDEEERAARAIESRGIESAGTEEQVTLAVENSDKSDKSKKPRGRPPKNAEKNKDDRQGSQKIEDFFTAKEYVEPFPRSSRTPRSPTVKITTNQGSDNIYVDKVTFEKGMADIREAIERNNQHLIEEMLGVMKSLTKEISKVELEAAKKEKRWEKEKAELLDGINSLNARVKTAEEKLEKYEEAQGLNLNSNSDALERIVDEKLQNRENRHENGTEKDLKKFLEYVEENDRKERKYNLVIRGLHLQSNRVIDEVSSFLRRDLGVDVGVYDAFEAGKDKKCIIATMNSWEDKKEVLINKRKLGQRRIYIDNDLTRQERDIQRELVNIMKTEREKGNISKIGYQKIKINDRWISYTAIKNGRSDNADFYRSPQI